MTYQTLSQYAVLVGSVSIVIGLWAQAIKIFNTKSAKDFTVIIVIALVINEVCWLNYGFSLSEWPMIVICCANIPAIVMIAIGYVKYRHQATPTTEGG